jgi:hypothetical protein
VDFSRPSKLLWRTAARRSAFGAARRAVLHSDVTSHSHERLFTRGAVLFVGSRQGDGLRQCIHVEIDEIKF